MQGLLTDKITIYHKIGDSYTMSVEDNCYWYGRSATSNSNSGVVNSSGYIVIAKPDINVDIGDVVYLGEGSPITSKKDLPQHDIFIVSEIKVLRKGSGIDHVEFSGN